MNNSKKTLNLFEACLNDKFINNCNIRELKALDRLLDGVATEKDRETLNLKSSKIENDFKDGFINYGVKKGFIKGGSND